MSQVHYFPAAILVHIWYAPTWRFHTELCKFLRNISTNICSLGERTDLKLGEVSVLFIFNRITISWLYPLNGFRSIFFLLRDSENDLYQTLEAVFRLLSKHLESRQKYSIARRNFNPFLGVSISRWNIVSRVWYMARKIVKQQTHTFVQFIDWKLKKSSPWWCSIW